LDDYLEGALATDERRLFVDHLRHCADCLRKIEEQRRLEELLQRATRHATPEPAGLVERIERRLQRQARRRSLVWVSGIAASLMLALGVAAWLQRLASSSHEQPETSVNRTAETIALPPAAERPLARVTVTSSGQVVAVPVKSRDPAVTIVWLYPARPNDAGEGPGALNPIGPLNRSRQ